ncbi:HHIP-like protein 2 [Ptychodera flava]|uniref:HHIP-like protein 2 n=1 Tax=Ptychodera flava TaxID=63121 RepID=UPI003969E38A
MQISLASRKTTGKISVVSVSRNWRPVTMTRLSIASTYSVIGTIVFIQSSWTHPQCLDYYPPFIPSKDLSFCWEYSDFGCCTTSRDSELKAEFEKVTQQINSLSNNCKNYIREIMCQECSPYASHIFDAETTQKQTSLPGLCKSFCVEFAQQCAHVVHSLTQDKEVISSLDISAEYFCDKIAIGDMDYCYPDILYNEEFNLELVVADGNSEGCLCVEEFANGLRNPLAAVHAGDGTHRLFVAEQRGKVYVYLRNGTKVVEPFLDLEDTVLTSSRRGDERGFLGIAFHPKYKDNRRFFIYYSFLNGNVHRTRISEMKVLSTDVNKADPSYERVLLDIYEPAANHNGGQILFGDDGFMYLFVGDGGKGGDPFGIIGNGQNLETLLGSVLRIDVDSQENGLPYGIPPDNPFIDVPNARNEIYAYGTRNMWRCSVDRGDPETGEGKGRIFCGDVGQNRYEEIDIIVRGGNYGWRGKEGFKCYDFDMCTDDYMGDDILPIHAYPHSVGKAVIGGYVYRGCQSPSLQGHYIFGDFYNGRLFKLTENPESGSWESHNVRLGDESICNNGLIGSYPNKILSFGEDEAGEVYILSTNFESPVHYGGKVMKIVDPARRGDPEKCRGNFVNGAPVHDNQPNEAAEGIPCRSRCPKFSMKIISEVFCKAHYALKVKVVSRRWYGRERLVMVDIEGVYHLNSTITELDDMISLNLRVIDQATLCTCPRLKVGSTYLLIGEYDFKRQTFPVTEDTIARKWNSKMDSKAMSLSSTCKNDHQQLTKITTYHSILNTKLDITKIRVN